MGPEEKALLIEQVRAGGFCRVRVGGFCMSPVVRDGATVDVAPLGESALMPGDIAAYFVGDQLKVHRCTAMQGDGSYVMRADSGSPDIHSVASEQVLGRVVAVCNPDILRRVVRRVVNAIRRNG